MPAMNPLLNKCSAVPLVLLLAMAGCGSKLSSLHGKVLFEDGKPLNAGTVIFQLIDAGEKTPNTRAYIQPDGSFSASTYKENDGMPPGKYRVAVFAKSWGLGPGETPPKDQIFVEAKYSDLNKSGLSVEVVPGNNEEKIITIPRPPKDFVYPSPQGH